MAAIRYEPVRSIFMSHNTVHIVGDSFFAPLAAVTLGRKLPQLAQDIQSRSPAPSIRYTVNL